MAKKLKDPAHPTDDATTAQTLLRLRELKQKIRDVFDSGQDRTAVAERIVDEMARRQGQRLAPFFDWSLATRDFQVRVDDALAQKSPGQSMDVFVQAFVDAWPRGMAAIRLTLDETNPLSHPPYSRDGLWPAYLEERK